MAEMLPLLLPDMTLYSLVSIAYRWGGFGRGYQVSESLFASRCAGLRHDFPSHLSEFCIRTDFAYGHPDQVAMNATVLPYFLCFRPNEVKTKAIALMRTDTVRSLKFILGLPAGPSGASMSLSYCQDCIREDINSNGFAYWHRQHQLPGVFVCANHGSPIYQSKLRINGSGRSTLYLPDDPEIITASSSLAAAPNLSKLYQLATLSATALNEELPGGFSPQVLLASYKHGLKAQGLLTPSGRVRANEFIKWLRDRYHSIADLHTFNRIINERLIDGMLRLVRKPHRNYHTAIHLLLIDAIFGSWDKFTSVYSWERQMEFPPSRECVLSPAETHLPSEHETLIFELAQRVKNGEKSVTALSKEFNIDVSTTMRWLGKLGLMDIQRRPKVLTKEIRCEIIQALKHGESLKKISKTFFLSRSTIDRICNEQPNLHQIWHAANHERKRSEERAKLDGLIQTNPNILLEDLRRTSNSGYSWLIRHDKEWLKSKITVKKISHRKEATLRRPRVDWTKRDNECLTALKTLETTLVFESWERIQPMTLLRKIPNLSFSPRLNQLPKSRLLADKILEKEKTRRNAKF